MPKYTDITIKADSNIQQKAEHIFNEIGIDTKTAINAFLRQVIYHKGMPFEIALPANTEQKNFLLLEKRYKNNYKAIQYKSNSEDFVEQK